MTFDDFCSQNSIVVVYHDFTPSIRGLCIKYDDIYIVSINPMLCTIAQRKTLHHEIIHIMENHFECNVYEYETCELEVHQIIKEMKNIYYFEYGSDYI